MISGDATGISGTATRTSNDASDSSADANCTLVADKNDITDIRSGSSEKPTTNTNALVALSDLFSGNVDNLLYGDSDLLLDIRRDCADRIRAADANATAGVLGRDAALILRVVADAAVDAEMILGGLFAIGFRALASADASTLPFLAGLLVNGLGPLHSLVDHVTSLSHNDIFSRCASDGIGALNRIVAGDDRASADFADALSRLLHAILGDDVDCSINSDADFDRDGFLFSDDDDSPSLQP
ncbi:unnamed protein product [Rotaria sp. Silwood1]|nr:unnamed protein product [Rotaria sp. Silwood1]CAF4862557.1 unnamed protein product [Rotaria sp. Silwood1]